MKKEVFKQETAEELIRLLHLYDVPYDLIYWSTTDQRDGTIKKWDFTFDPEKLVDTLVNP